MVAYISYDAIQDNLRANYQGLMNKNNSHLKDPCLFVN